MSNGLTSVFLGVLTIAMSALAVTESEKRMAVWIASHDQAIFGSGMVDFDVRELSWSLSAFDADRRFVLAAIDAAAGKFEWHKLDYSPREDWVLESLHTFRILVEQFSREQASAETERTWDFGAEPAQFERCEKHQVYLHSHSCLLCNDG